MGETQTKEMSFRTKNEKIKNVGKPAKITIIALFNAIKSEETVEIYKSS